jgi:hypothetical protein
MSMVVEVGEGEGEYGDSLGEPRRRGKGPFNRLMELSLVDASNPIHEWMEHARSTVQPELDEESPDTDALIPSAMVIAIAHP